MGGRIGILVAMLAGVVVNPAPAPAQLSPGSLSAAHQEMSGVRRCLDCHAVGEQTVEDNCMACHSAIGWLREKGRGLHGMKDLGECAACHPEHRGESFGLIHWKEGSFEKFDHRRSGWPLEGKHARVRCRDCHQTRFQVSPVLGMRKGGSPEETWLGLETSCASCHRDPHEGRLGNRCAGCHTTQSFREILNASFDHQLTRFPLRGKHVQVACEKCHEPTKDGIRLPGFETCASCHRDPHAGRATLSGKAADCADCHSVEGFRPSTFTVARHRKTRYPLTGKHAQVACERCHRPTSERARAGLGSAGVRFRPPTAHCADCHGDAHGGQLTHRPDRGSCEACHRVEGFRPTTFTVADHEKTGFPLRGKHEKVACRNCHGPERRGLPPVTGRKGLGKAGVALRPNADCGSCHREPHRGRFSPKGKSPKPKGCVTCHNFEGFRHSSMVDPALHATFAFPLKGAHLAVPCVECHRELQRERSSSTLLNLAPRALHLAFDVKGKNCRDCHEDPHGGQFRGRRDKGSCRTCHDVSSFKPASRFDHDRQSRFKLEGAHEKVACRKCHPTRTLPDGKKAMLFRPIVPHRCEDCHASPPPDLKGRRR